MYELLAPLRSLHTATTPAQLPACIDFSISYRRDCSWIEISRYPIYVITSWDETRSAHRFWSKFIAVTVFKEFLWLF